jgi:putative toxin-antitoxin system antitoxin component (TIGR02293 family)
MENAPADNRAAKSADLDIDADANSGNVAPTEDTFERLAAYGFSDTDALRFAVPRQNIVLKLKKHQRIALSERDAERVLAIFAYADRVFGRREKAQRWLREPCRAISNVVPLDLLDSDAGAQLVKDELIRIEHGIYV